jgi:extradiol dioxygenase family protein
MGALFHLAINVTDLDQARAFYGGVLECVEGRSTDTWVDYNFFGHQLSLHLGAPFTTQNTGVVGEHKVPMPHFGAMMELCDWRTLADRLEAKGQTFIIAPVVRFAGQAGEQHTMFFTDPFGNPIEIKGVDSLSRAFEI